MKLRFQLAEAKKVPGIDHIDVTFEGVQIRKLWENFNKRKGSPESEITQEEMERFHSALRTHVRNTTKLCLDNRSIFILSQVFILASYNNIAVIRGIPSIQSLRIIRHGIISFSYFIFIGLVTNSLGFK